MSAREALLRGFLEASGWGGARRGPLAGDASHRRYERLQQSGASAVLMDAPPEQGEDIAPFVAIARHLSRLGLSPPAILAQDRASGFLLLEDLGDALFARLLERDPLPEEQLYAAAVDLLAALHRHPAPEGLPAYGPARMGPLAGLAGDWYLPGITGRQARGAGPALAEATGRTLEALAPLTPVLALRDYHAENLIWLPERSGIARVGLLDFQDAMAGHPAYDLVSLLKDARRDVAPALRRAMTERYLAATGAAPEPFAAAAAALSAQRNLRILGVFARLSLRDGKPHYARLIPRVWAHLQGDLAHPALARLARTVNETLPPPSAAGIARIEAEAGSCPAR